MRQGLCAAGHAKRAPRVSLTFPSRTWVPFCHNSGPVLEWDSIPHSFRASCLCRSCTNSKIVCAFTLESAPPRWFYARWRYDTLGQTRSVVREINKRMTTGSYWVTRCRVTTVAVCRSQGLHNRGGWAERSFSRAYLPLPARNLSFQREV